MAKSYKIKRYRYIYRRRRFSPIKAVLLLLLAAVLAFVGFSLYGPVSDFWSGRLLQRMQSSSASEPEPEPESPPPSEPERESEPVPVQPEIRGMHAVHIPQEILLSGQALPYLQGLSLPDINTALIDLKNEEGRVLYQSQVGLSMEEGIVHEQAIDLSAAVAELEAAGYQVAGRICAFRDPLAPYAQAEAAVKYQDTDWSWLDNSQEAGGRPWLNPYSPIAQGYIRDLSSEAAGMGVRLLFITDIQFPEGLGRHLATFGAGSAAQSQAEVLRTFAEGLQEHLGQQGADVIPSLSGIHLLGQGLQNPYGGTNPAQIFTSRALSVQMMPALFGEVFEAEGFRLSAPATTPYETVQAVAGKIRATTPEGTTLIPWLQGYTAQNLSTAANLTYTEAEIALQVQAAAEAGMDSYIIEY